MPLPQTASEPARIGAATAVARPSAFRSAFWLTLSLVSLLLSAAFLLLLAHPPPSSPPSSSPHNSNAIIANAPPPSADDVDSSQSSHFHAQIMPSIQQMPFGEPEQLVELIISGPAPDPSQKSTLPAASNPAMFNEVRGMRPILYIQLIPLIYFRLDGPAIVHNSILGSSFLNE
jgi:hypothetical protein